MNNDGCECAICLNDIINNNNNCDTCKNGICNTCYIKMIERTYEPFNNDISYICPFCKTENFKKWRSVDNDIIVDYFTVIEYKQKDEMWKLRDIIYHRDNEINRLKTIIKNKKQEIIENKELIETQSNIINNILMNLPKPPEAIKKLKYQEFYKITYRNLKTSEIKLSPQEAMKRVSVLWREYKKSFEIVPEPVQVEQT
jgi:hypothetical protein